MTRTVLEALVLPRTEHGAEAQLQRAMYIHTLTLHGLKTTTDVIGLEHIRLVIGLELVLLETWELGPDGSVRFRFVRYAPAGSLVRLELAPHVALEGAVVWGEVQRE